MIDLSTNPTVIDRGDLVDVVGQATVPKDEANVDWQTILQWIADGGTLQPYEGTPEYLSDLRLELRRQVEAEAMARIATQIPILETFQQATVIAAIWPLLNTSSASPQLLKARDIYVFAQGLLGVIATANAATLETYDVSAQSWPTVTAQGREDLIRILTEVINQHVIKLLATIHPALGSKANLDLIDLIWPALDREDIPPELRYARRVIRFSIRQIRRLEGITFQELMDYDVEAQDWPQ